MFATSRKRNGDGRPGSERRLHEVTKSQESLECSGDGRVIRQEGAVPGGEVRDQSE